MMFPISLLPPLFMLIFFSLYHSHYHSLLLRFSWYLSLTPIMTSQLIRITDVRPFIQWYWLLTIVVSIEQQGVSQFIFHFGWQPKPKVKFCIFMIVSRSIVGGCGGFVFVFLFMSGLVLMLMFLLLLLLFFFYYFFYLRVRFSCFFYSKMSLKLLKFTSRDIRCKATLSGMCIQNSFLRAIFFSFYSFKW